MKIDGSGNLTRELRQLAGDITARQQVEESELDRKRLGNLGELLLIAADMAADIEGVPPSGADLPGEVVDEMFGDMLYREWPEGPPVSP